MLSYCDSLEHSAFMYIYKQGFGGVYEHEKLLPLSEKERYQENAHRGCNMIVKAFRNPLPTVDIIIEQGRGVVLILRRNEPRLWAIPGGFCDYGESLEQAAIRETREETGLEVELIEQFHTYSAPRRDPRRHTITTVYIARAVGGTLQAGDDAQEVGIFTDHDLPTAFAFDHDQILKDYFLYRKTGQRKALDGGG